MKTVTLIVHPCNTCRAIRCADAMLDAIGRRGRVIVRTLGCVPPSCPCGAHWLGLVINGTRPHGVVTHPYEPDDN